MGRSLTRRIGRGSSDGITASAAKDGLVYYLGNNMEAVDVSLTVIGPGGKEKIILLRLSWKDGVQWSKEVQDV